MDEGLLKPVLQQGDRALLDALIILKQCYITSFKMFAEHLTSFLVLKCPCPNFIERVNKKNSDIDGIKN